MSTTRTQLLEMAKAFPHAMEEWLSLGAAEYSAEGVAAKAQEVQQKVKDKEARMKRLPYFHPEALFVMVIALLLAAAWALCYSPWLSAAVVVLTVKVVLAQGHGVGLRDDTTDLNRRLRRLAPIAGTDSCRQALQYVQAGHPEVLAWRDMAIADRGQLYMFDVEIMGYLHHQAEHNRAEAEQRRLNEEACRVVHGIAPASV